LRYVWPARLLQNRNNVPPMSDRSRLRVAQDEGGRGRRALVAPIAPGPCRTMAVTVAPANDPPDSLSRRAAFEIWVPMHAMR
jgi:hypothetical protein